MRRAYTIIELAFVLVLLGTTCLTLLPPARHLRDRMAVVAAREAVAGLFARAHVEALSRGGSTVHVRSRPWRAWSESSDSVLGRVDLERDFSVILLLSGGRDSADIRYDALGVGRVASETMRFRRDEAEAALIVSGYGRVRRR